MTDGKRFLRQSGPPILRGDEWIKPKAMIVLCDAPGCTSWGVFRRGWLNGKAGEAWCRAHLPGDYFLTAEPHTAPDQKSEAENAQGNGLGDLFAGPDVDG